MPSVCKGCGLSPCLLLLSDARQTGEERPLIKFRTSRRAFLSEYERWCYHNQLLSREVWTRVELTELLENLGRCLFGWSM